MSPRWTSVDLGRLSFVPQFIHRIQMVLPGNIICEMIWSEKRLSDVWGLLWLWSSEREKVSKMGTNTDEVPGVLNFLGASPACEGNVIVPVYRRRNQSSRSWVTSPSSRMGRVNCAQVHKVDHVRVQVSHQRSATSNACGVFLYFCPQPHLPPWTPLALSLLCHPNHCFIWVSSWLLPQRAKSCWLYEIPDTASLLSALCCSFTLALTFTRLFSLNDRWPCYSLLKTFLGLPITTG